MATGGTPVRNDSANDESALLDEGVSPEYTFNNGARWGRQAQQAPVLDQVRHIASAAGDRSLAAALCQSGWASFTPAPDALSSPPHAGHVCSAPLLVHTSLHSSTLCFAWPPSLPHVPLSMREHAAHPSLVAALLQNLYRGRSRALSHDSHAQSPQAGGAHVSEGYDNNSLGGTGDSNIGNAGYTDAGSPTSSVLMDMVQRNPSRANALYQQRSGRGHRDRDGGNSPYSPPAGATPSGQQTSDITGRTGRAGDAVRFCCTWRCLHCCVGSTSCAATSHHVACWCANTLCTLTSHHCATPLPAASIACHPGPLRCRR